MSVSASSSSSSNSSSSSSSSSGSGSNKSSSSSSSGASKSSESNGNSSASSSTSHAGSSNGNSSTRDHVDISDEAHHEKDDDSISHFNLDALLGKDDNDTVTHRNGGSGEKLSFDELMDQPHKPRELGQVGSDDDFDTITHRNGNEDPDSDTVTHRNDCSGEKLSFDELMDQPHKPMELGQVDPERKNRVEGHDPEKKVDGFDPSKIVAPRNEIDPPNFKDKDKPGTTTVTVGKWGTGDNDCIYNALIGAGYTKDQILNSDLIDQVAQMNNLDDPNVIQAGMQLKLPTPDANEIVKKIMPNGPNPANPDGEIPDFGRDANRAEINQQLEAAAAKYGIPANVLKAVAWQESTWRANASSFDGGHGKGVMQIDDRWHQFAKTSEVWDSASNIDYGTKYLADLYGKYGNWDKALDHYNGSSTYSDLIFKHMDNQPWTAYV